MPIGAEKRDNYQYAISLGFSPNDAEKLRRWMKTRIKHLAEYWRFIKPEKGANQ